LFRPQAHSGDARGECHRAVRTPTPPISAPCLARLSYVLVFFGTFRARRSILDACPRPDRSHGPRSGSPNFRQLITCLARPGARAAPREGRLPECSRSKPTPALPLLCLGRWRHLRAGRRREGQPGVPRRAKSMRPRSGDTQATRPPSTISRRRLSARGFLSRCSPPRANTFGSHRRVPASRSPPPLGRPRDLPGGAPSVSGNRVTGGMYNTCRRFTTPTSRYLRRVLSGGQNRLIGPEKAHPCSASPGSS